VAGLARPEPAVIADAPFGAVTEPIRQATPKDVGYHAH
jgi:hypothetical protein